MKYFLGAIAGLILLWLFSVFIVQPFAIPSNSMEPALSTGDRILVNKTAYRSRPITRGDVVVFDGVDSFSRQSGEFVKRVIGIAGDRVVCCTDSGNLSVNGSEIQEDSYLFPGDSPSEIEFDAYHARHGSSAQELRVNVPISLRGDAGDRSGQAANAVAIARFPMQVAGQSAVELMNQAHELVAKWRSEPAMRLADPLAEVSWFVPIPMLASVARASDITTSNVPGPPIPIYLAGSRMIAVYPLVATIGAAVNVTMVTYDSKAFIGVSTDDRAIGDHVDLMHDLRAGFHAVTLAGDTL